MVASWVSQVRLSTVVAAVLPTVTMMRLSLGADESVAMPAILRAKQMYTAFPLQASFEPLGLTIAVAKDRAIESLMQVPLLGAGDDVGHAGPGALRSAQALSPHGPCLTRMLPLLLRCRWATPLC